MTSLLEVIPRIEEAQYTTTCRPLANVGLLIGLLGTITGLIGGLQRGGNREPGGEGQLAGGGASRWR